VVEPAGRANAQPLPTTRNQAAVRNDVGSVSSKSIQPTSIVYRFRVEGLVIDRLATTTSTLVILRAQNARLSDGPRPAVSTVHGLGITGFTVTRGSRRRTTATLNASTTYRVPSGAATVVQRKRS
jgi:hypothetical protein